MVEWRNAHLRSDERLLVNSEAPLGRVRERYVCGGMKDRIGGMMKGMLEL